jgi:hypothetical protein
MGYSMTSDTNSMRPKQEHWGFVLLSLKLTFGKGGTFDTQQRWVVLSLPAERRVRYGVGMVPFSW